MALKQRLSLLALALIGTLVAAHFGCDLAPRTQIVVVVDTDFDIPDGLDTIVIDASAPDGQDHSSSIELEGSSSLPATVTLVHEGGPLGPFTVEASGEREGSTIVEREAEVSFVPDRSLVLTLHLVEACSGFPCPAFETCSEEGCVDPERDDLPEWNGTPPRLDGGDGDGDADVDSDVDGDTDSDVDGDGDTDVDGDGDTDADSDGDGDGDVDADTDADSDDCIPTDEVCNGEDDDCDDEIDEDFDLETDVDNCGSCELVCNFQNGTGECRGGECVVLDCDTGFDNCNDDGTDGCETNIDETVEHCGACDDPCPAVLHGSGLCSGGECAVDTCDTGWGDCDPGVDGCETDIDETVEHCGACDDPCPAVLHGSGLCSGGECAVDTCDTGWGDCDPGVDGCETDVTADADNCGGCGTLCDHPQRNTCCFSECRRPENC